MLSLHMPRKILRSEARIVGRRKISVARIEQFARQLVELFDTEKQLVASLTDVRRMKAQVIAELAAMARDVQK